jgi:hypothetical protein
VLDPEIAKQLLVVAPGVLEFRCRRNDADARILAATYVDESVQNFGVVEFFFGAAYRDDVSAIDMLVVICWAHGIRTLALGPKKAGIVHDSARKLCPHKHGLVAP